MTRTAKLLGERRTVSQLHFGGGTPTFLTIEELSGIFDSLAGLFTFLPNAERSIELDPRVTTPAQLEFLASRGVNRVSMGVQDLDQTVQEAIGRIQPATLVAERLAQCRQVGFRGINFDLIYGLPKQTIESFATTLDQIVALRPDRLAIYSFAYLPTVKANQVRIQESDLPSTETKYRLFATAVEKLTAAGYRQIGMDHFALPGDELTEAQADGRLHRNFMGYTVQSAGEMIGLGMSSIGYVDHTFFQNNPKLSAYQEAIDKSEPAVYRGMRLSEDDLVRQYTIESLMCNFRLLYSDFDSRFGIPYHDYYKSELAGLEPFVSDGLLEVTDERLEVTPLGRTFVRNIAMTFDAYLGGDGRSNRATFSRTI
jgi:oxygen-independent coproporphyrinogen-3 oxidase